MSMRAWLSSRPKASSSTHSLNALEEAQLIQDAMHAVSHIINDDVEAADKGLSEGNSPFHQLGKGLVTFMKATLGFEQDIMREASEKLASAEASASEHQRRAQRNPSSSHASIYAPGTEFALCVAESQLMSAVVGVLNESLTEAVRGFYKMRKAYITLDAILEQEKRFVDLKGGVSESTSASQSTVSTVSSEISNDVTTKNGGEGSTTASLKGLPGVATGKADQKAEAKGEVGIDEFYDADEDHADIKTPAEYLGHFEKDGYFYNTTASKSEDNLTLTSTTTKPRVRRELSVAQSYVEPGPDQDLFQGDPVDGFIHSGSNLCFGILNLMISLIPPAFAMLLKIVGFKGDRERGIAMLWQATKFNNINGAMAGLVILGYYNGLVGFCDILPRSGKGARPDNHCKELLKTMRERYPKSTLWLLEDARMAAGDRHPDKAIELLSKNEKSSLKQIEALQWFERSLDCMYLHRYQDCSDGFQKCITLNNWSHGLYYYIAGVAHVELYRDHKKSNPEKAKTHAKKAEELLRQVAKNSGRKRFMARQLPFDVFVNRKIAKWDARAAEWKVDFIDAVGVSPIEEMIYFWNGYKRMRPEHLEESLQRLAWSTGPDSPHWDKERLDEQAILSLLKAATYRNLGRWEESKNALQNEIMNHEWHEFKHHLRDNWTCPCAHYEMAANLYAEFVEGKKGEEALKECNGWLEKVANWESYDLDARIGLKVTTARETMKRYGVGADA